MSRNTDVMRGQPSALAATPGKMELWCSPCLSFSMSQSHSFSVVCLSLHVPPDSVCNLLSCVHSHGISMYTHDMKAHGTTHMTCSHIHTCRHAYLWACPSRPPASSPVHILREEGPRKSLFLCPQTQGKPTADVQTVPASLTLATGTPTDIWGI